MRILVVDDDPGISNALRAFFLSHGWQVTVAADGLQALEIMQTTSEGTQVDFLVTDQKMGAINGLELLRVVRTGRPQLPCVLMTAFGDDALREQVLALGCLAYLEKPFSPQILAEMVQRAGEREQMTGAGERGVVNDQ